MSDEHTDQSTDLFQAHYMPNVLSLFHTHYISQSNLTVYFNLDYIMCIVAQTLLLLFAEISGRT